MISPTRSQDSHALSGGTWLLLSYIVLKAPLTLQIHGSLLGPKPNLEKYYHKAMAQQVNLSFELLYQKGMIEDEMAGWHH